MSKFKAGIVVGQEPSKWNPETSFYYLVKDCKYGMISNVNPVKVIGLDKEWYREQKLNKIYESSLFINHR